MFADAATIDAQSNLERLGSILAHTLKVDDRVDWEHLRKRAIIQESASQILHLASL